MTFKELNSELIDCRRCPRLVAWREQVAREKRHAYRDQVYWGRPVPGFGDPRARVLVIGLAPGAHGSNRTGRMFTGDASGDFLYPALYRAGFASQPEARSRKDGLTLKDLYITAVCRCVPPENKPTLQEMANCRSYLEREIELIRPKVFVALGRIAFNALKSILHAPASIAFSHNIAYHLETTQPGAGYWLLVSYHPSRQNTQTGRLTAEMFDQVWVKARELLER